MISIDHRRAPAHPFPAALGDVHSPTLFEGEVYAERRAEAGVPVRKRCHEELAHSFLAEPPRSPEVEAAIEEIAAWIGSLKVAANR